MGNIGGRIPSSIGNLTKLKVIDFDYNQLTGRLPNTLYTLNGLEELDLNDNKLKGTIDEAIGEMESLTFLQLHNNDFVGTLPNTLIFAPLAIAEFKSNKFRGLMPLCVGAPLQSVEVISCDCGTGKVTCAPGCGCECF